MLKNILFFSISLFLSCCSSCTEKKEPVTDIEVATAFVRYILDNKFDEAEKFLLKNETNTELFNRFRKQYNDQQKDVLDKYKSADILVNETDYVVEDSIYIFNYSNSYARDIKNKLKLVRVNGKWLVDFQYTFSGNL
jgi:hypothetical protein